MLPSANAINSDGLKLVSSNRDMVYRVAYTDLPDKPELFKGKYGYFIESHDPDLRQFQNIVSQKYQTVTYYGVEPHFILNVIRTSGLLGVDRIVPVGRALDIGLTWDGFDLLSSLSRVLDYK